MRLRSRAGMLHPQLRSCLSGLGPDANLVLSVLQLSCSPLCPERPSLRELVFVEPEECLTKTQWDQSLPTKRRWGSIC